jgi:hypothetical protein
MGFGLKSKSFGGMGRKIQNQVAIGKKNNTGRKANNSIQAGNKVIQLLKPLETVPIYGTAIKGLVGASDVIAKSSQITQDELVRQNQARRNREAQSTARPSGNALERATVMPRDEPQEQIFV